MSYRLHPRMYFEFIISSKDTSSMELSIFDYAESGSFKILFEPILLFSLMISQDESIRVEGKMVTPSMAKKLINFMQMRQYETARVSTYFSPGDIKEYKRVIYAVYKAVEDYFKSATGKPDNVKIDMEELDYFKN